MPAARESLLDAAYAALTARPWCDIRMVEVAAAAGVSRQTLYNEFGSKDGLARALVRRETDNYLAGVARVLARGGTGRSATHRDGAARVVAAAAWTLRTARSNPLVRAALTGCWGDRLPAPSAAAEPAPGELVGRFCAQAVAALEPDWPAEELPALGTACETAARLTLSCVVAPPAPAPPGTAPPGRVPAQRTRRDQEAEAVSRLVRGAFGRPAGDGERSAAGPD
ncbi:TetR/AcrR family transcriptional regulator [Streptomyces sp. NRRL S-337]|uniref:TetR/AcrR family transcriptional regulator n=1 Tax=Streptomyces sp. NRRL S-337 TaxID=1463900 RepID=UPI00056432A1|nr:TetR/AcrR family transcriptional regulator [Streptomyces sp. NRRL S-337]